MKIFSIPSLLINVLMSFFLTAEIGCQDSITFEPIAHPDKVVTWVDYFGTTIKTHLDLPPNLTQANIETDKIQAKHFMLARKMNVLKREADGTPTIQVNYVPIIELTGFSLPIKIDEATDLGKPLLGSTFRVNCKDGSAVIVKDEVLTPITTDLNTFNRECTEVLRYEALKGFFQGMRQGDVKQAKAGGKPAILKEELEKLGIKDWSFKLTSVTGSLPTRATFEVKASVDPIGSLGKGYSDCVGTLILASDGGLVDLKLRCTALAVTDAVTQVKNSGEILIVLQRQRI